jgi:hypothetical protein
MLLRRLPAVLLHLGTLSFGPCFAAALPGRNRKAARVLQARRPTFIRNGDVFRGPRLS